MARSIIFISLAVALAGCSQSSSLPGDSLGEYSVVADLASNTCGSGLGAEDPWKFSAEMSLDGDTLYLDQSNDSDGSELVSGNLDSEDETMAILTSEITTNVDTSANGVAGPCNLTFRQSYELVLNDASASKSFSGVATFTYSAATGISSTTNCTDQLSSQGGKYATLPCTVEYTLQATRK